MADVDTSPEQYMRLEATAHRLALELNEARVDRDRYRRRAEEAEAALRRCAETLETIMSELRAARVVRTV